jgi:hypothetical protein
LPGDGVGEWVCVPTQSGNRRGCKYAVRGATGALHDVSAPGSGGAVLRLLEDPRSVSAAQTDSSADAVEQSAETAADALDEVANQVGATANDQSRSLEESANAVAVAVNDQAY